MAIHEHFEELCALATIGDLREDELQEMQEHLQECPACQSALAGFEELYSILEDAADAEGNTIIPEGMTQRFLLRARAAGIEVAPFVVQPRTSPLLRKPVRLRPRVVAALLAVVIIAIIAFAAGMRFQSRRSLSRSNATSSPQHVIVPAQENTGAAEDISGLNEEVRKLRERLQVPSSELEDKKRALVSTKAETDSLAARARDLERTNSTLQENESSRNADLAQLKQDLAQARTRQNETEVALLADEEKIWSLRAELKSTEDLNAALSEAHELIVDRNVHVLNVFPEVDESVKFPQPRGRIFYAEGKKLVFYAYDLAEPGKISAKASFYLWGEAPKPQQLVNLGKFQIDNEHQGRWVLRVTDPKLLAQLDSIFVTLESDKQTVTKPTGKRMLSRLLHSNPDNR